jgi:uncharacterized protein (TIGR02145 family)
MGIKKGILPTKRFLHLSMQFVLTKICNMETNTKFRFYTPLLFGILLVISVGCSKDDDDSDTVTDIDGNVYHTVTIGTQIWMVENLKVTKYRNGDQIQFVTDNSAWTNLTTGGYSIYNNNTDTGATYGNLYNWRAVTDSRNICPTGWHVPDESEFQDLIEFLGGEAVAGGKMKELGLAHWSSPNTGATDSSGFSALPGGVRGSNGSFTFIGLSCNFWSSDDFSTGNAIFLYLINTDAKAVTSNTNKMAGLSVRCIRD